MSVPIPCTFIILFVFSFFQIRLRVGMYSVFISDWIDVFGRDNVLVMKMEDFNGANKTAAYEIVLKYLNISKFNK